ncbi:cytochrome C biosynthesis protein [Sphingomonas ginkgonis]|uniref:Cytochrome C biosynthesis protein n=1 Tax=Sphingomonas ginkgonis TaxID=2315330 RepID=A0A3R9WPA6_9SPHN|nr:tetratricopeptide repeat protein [Sphingomonas ginkgonis]RST31149.1 cytochrome C biosynthesis protein [Sphingomonas ginkgonis]
MNGWMILLLLVAMAGAGFLLLGRLRGTSLQLALAALLFGAAGYAVQANPSYDGNPREFAPPRPPLPLTVPRHALLGRFNQTDTWATIAESLARKGDTQGAAQIMQSAVRSHPNDVGLWTVLGNTLVDHAGALTPPAQFAYDRALRLAPDHPAPLFFLGLARARSGDRAGALELWNRMLAKSPGVSWRPMVEGGIVALGGQPGR